MDIEIHSARMPDADAICEIVNFYAERGRMLYRSLDAVYATLRNFLVAKSDDSVCGCVSLEISWANLAEIKSLAVRPEFVGKGIGKRLVAQAIEDARKLGVHQLFALTYEKDFFLRCGFHEIRREDLPYKVWSDCIACAKRNACDETAMLMEL